MRLAPHIKLRVLTEDGREFPISLENGELFRLPLLPDPKTNADLVSKLADGQLRIGLLVHTRSVPPEKERLGDVRLRLAHPAGRRAMGQRCPHRVRLAESAAAAVPGRRGDLQRQELGSPSCCAKREVRSAKCE